MHELEVTLTSGKVMRVAHKSAYNTAGYIVDDFSNKRKFWNQGVAYFMSAVESIRYVKEMKVGEY